MARALSDAVTRENELDEELKRLKKQLADTVAGKDKAIGHLQGSRPTNTRSTHSINTPTDTRPVAHPLFDDDILMTLQCWVIKTKKKSPL